MNVKKITIPLYLLLLLSLLTISCTTIPGPKEKESKPLFPEGKELITLLSATISPEIITIEGSDLKVNFVNKDSLSMTNLTPVFVFITNTMTITTRTRSSSGLIIQDGSYFTVTVSNPKDSYSYSKGRLSGSGTIYVYLEDSGDGDKRVSNILSVYATFK